MNGTISASNRAEGEARFKILLPAAAESNALHDKKDAEGSSRFKYDRAERSMVCETAIQGVLGIDRLGFYVDSAVADVRFDGAPVVILFICAFVRS
jgi:hypothetical protein